MLMNRGSNMQNGLVHPVTLAFDILTTNAYHFEYPKIIPYTKFEHFGIIHFWVMLRTNKQTIPDVLYTFYIRSTFPTDNNAILHIAISTKKWRNYLANIYDHLLAYTVQPVDNVGLRAFSSILILRLFHSCGWIHAMRLKYNTKSNHAIQSIQ